ncbi:hypothetical protein MBCUT_12690 [Methanobrevibacter cuticularis]|uniref:Uncharacterized protein n=1 Tax=Methanobrevibacter cuticularis TaxID=47311 RepID=A0A166DMS1_9EURY|nr:hypothetical protein [Methanobrevibacter cuticularis]KZX15766.1 hypothetical protein MBCUT_12690 [Methanobrevibacter cuticularis]
MEIKSLYEDFKIYEKIVNNHDFTLDYLDLKNIYFIKPTTLLPAFNFMNEYNIEKYDPNFNTRTYLRGVFRAIKNKNTTLPIKPLPQVLTDLDKFNILENIRSLLKKNYVEEQSFEYLAIEIMNNISEHSKYNNAYIFAQQYPNIDFTDICFLDDGITIPESLRRAGNYYDNDNDYIIAALNGKSSDINNFRMRGSGLNSSHRIISEGFGGEMLIVSGKGLCHITPEGVFLGINDNYFKGTIVSLRINEKVLGNEIHNYTSHKEIQNIANYIL